MSSGAGAVVGGQPGTAARLGICAMLLLCSPLCSQGETSAPSDAMVLQKMMELVQDDFAVQVPAAEWLLAQRDISMIPAILDAMQIVEIHTDIGWLLDDATGQNFRFNWAKWMEWLGRQEFENHPAYPFFKQRLYKQIDPAFAALLNPGYRARIRWDEVVWGGVKKDGIPPLMNPVLLNADAADFLDEDDVVIGIIFNGEAHAYPLRILNWHELLNTEIGGVSVTLVYCSLCGAALSYRGDTNDTTYTFGTSGLLYRSNKLMYDHQTQSLWSSIYGEPVIGKLADQSIELTRIPNVRTQWAAWKSAYPHTKVLDKKTGYDRDYDNTNPYQRYVESDRTMFPIALRNERLKVKEWVYGIEAGNIRKAYPLSSFEHDPVINDIIAEVSLVLVGDARSQSVRAYKRGNIDFEGRTEVPNMLVDTDGQRWKISEDQLINQGSGQTLARIPGRLMYWFAWYAFYNDTEIWADGK